MHDFEFVCLSKGSELWLQVYIEIRNLQCSWKIQVVRKHPTMFICVNVYFNQFDLTFFENNLDQDGLQNRLPVFWRPGVGIGLEDQMIGSSKVGEICCAVCECARTDVAL